MRSDGLGGEEWTSPPVVDSEALRWAIRWGAIVGAVALFDLYRNSRGDGSTLCNSVRWVFNTDTQEGRAVFEAALFAFHKHILR
jgi:hypothetical protein